MWIVLGTGLSPVSLVTGDVAALSDCVHSQSPGGLELARDATTGDGGGIHRGCQESLWAVKFLPKKI